MLDSRSTWPSSWARCCRPSADLTGLGSDGRQDLIGLGMAAGLFLRIDELAVHHDLEDPASRGDQGQVLYLMLELF